MAKKQKANQGLNQMFKEIYQNQILNTTNSPYYSVGKSVDAILNEQNDRIIKLESELNQLKNIILVKDL